MDMLVVAMVTNEVTEVDCLLGMCVCLCLSYLWTGSVCVLSQLELQTLKLEKLKELKQTVHLNQNKHSSIFTGENMKSAKASLIYICFNTKVFLKPGKNLNLTELSPFHFVLTLWSVNLKHQLKNVNKTETCYKLQVNVFIYCIFDVSPMVLPPCGAEWVLQHLCRTCGLCGFFFFFFWDRGNKLV